MADPLSQRLRSLLPDGGPRVVAFIAATVFQKMGQLLLLLGVAFLGSEMDIYRFGLFISLFALAVPLFSQNIHMSVGRISFDYKQLDQRSRYQAAALLVALTGVAIGSLAVFLLVNGLDWSDPLTLGDQSLALIVVGAMLVFTANQFFGILLRLLPTARQFLTFGLISGLGAIAVFVAAFALGAPPLFAAIVGYIGAQLIASSYALATHKQLITRPSLSGMGHAYNYAVGTLALSIVQWITNYSGRWLAQDALSTEELAAYTLIGQALVALTMLITSVLESRRAVIMSDFANERARQGLARIDACFRPVLLLLLMFFASLAAAAYLANLWDLFAFEIAYEWVLFSGLFAFAYCLSMRTFWLSTGLKRTKTFGFAAFVGAAINLGFVVGLGLQLGIIGLLLGSILGLLAQAVLARVLLIGAMREMS